MPCIASRSFQQQVERSFCVWQGVSCSRKMGQRLDNKEEEEEVKDGGEEGEEEEAEEEEKEVEEEERGEDKKRRRVELGKVSQFCVAN